MPRSNKTQYALLGFLALRPMSGYDIKKWVEASISNFWNENYGQIYPALKSLTEAGLATKTSDETAGGRARHVYALTEEGRAELERWLAEPTRPPSIRFEHLLKLFFGANADVGVSIEQIEARRVDCVSELKRFRSIEYAISESESDAAQRPFWLMTVRNGIRATEADIEWCDESLVELRAMAAQEAPELAGAAPGAGKARAGRS